LRSGEALLSGRKPIRCTGNFGTVNGNHIRNLDNLPTYVFKDGMERGSLIATATMPPDARIARGTDATKRADFGLCMATPINVKRQQADLLLVARRIWSAIRCVGPRWINPSIPTK